MKRIAVVAIALILTGSMIPSAAQAGMQQRQVQQQRQSQQQRQMQQRQQRQMQMRRYNQSQRAVRGRDARAEPAPKRSGHEQEQRTQMQILKNQKEYGGRDILDYEDKPAFHYWY